jgi:hypothetical protein
MNHCVLTMAALAFLALTACTMIHVEGHHNTVSENGGGHALDVLRPAPGIAQPPGTPQAVP